MTSRKRGKERIVPLDKPAPKRIGKYILTRELGRGSTSTVYLCHDAYRGRDVAVKLYTSSDELSSEEAEIRRRLFFNEAQMAGMLDHPNILPILDAGELDDVRYVVMEYISGARPLSEHTHPDHLLPVGKAVEVAFKCARALEYAHRQGVIHRDIKPGNILLTRDGDVRLVDFGVARTALGGLNQVRGLIGSPSYMPPEQLTKHITTRETDLYALGVVLYELLTGKRPFYGDTLEKLRQQVSYASPMPVHRLREEVPPELERIVNRSLEKQPGRRYRSGLEFAADLSQAFKQAARLRQQLVEQERFRQLRHLSFFRDFAYPDIWELLNAGSWEEFREGETVVRAGELDQSFFVLVSGCVAIQRSGERVGQLRAGQCFGEAGYLDEVRRDSSIVAAEEVEVLRLTATAVDRCSSDCQLRFMRQFLRMLLARLSS
ncbi:serine/threonine protein kinase [Natronospira proteinivora]|uniref:Serine/threonine protein kinase n=1 Tax=Natronospira proteinivora TaxID=1807133 RepID=A0ABT1G770_9GAMM|nr:serine/threonine-protein kinase [Natronospira proteinivora]MCP1727136.1 serine/threonine protein kinase [Natronospira proteinivora]